MERLIMRRKFVKAHEVQYVSIPRSKFFAFSHRRLHLPRLTYKSSPSLF
jgi:hypothetical protein